MNERTLNILTHLGNGNILQAFQSFFQSPHVSFDEFPLNDNLDLVLANYLDTAAFYPSEKLYLPNRILIDFLKTTTEYPKEIAEAALDYLTFESCLLSLRYKIPHDSIQDFILKYPLIQEWIEGLKAETLFPTEKKNLLLDQIPKKFKSSFIRLFEFSQAWLKFKKKKAHIADLIVPALANGYDRPWVPLAYPKTPIEEINFIGPKTSDTPHVFLEPSTQDYSRLKQSLKDTFAVFVFKTRFHLIQMLQFPEILETLTEPNHWIYLLDQYPNSQLLCQGFTKPLYLNFNPLGQFITPEDKERILIFTNALEQTFSQSVKVMSSDSEIGNWLYSVQKRLLQDYFSIKSGVSLSPGFKNMWDSFLWQDHHKTSPSPNRPLGPDVFDAFKMKLKKLETLRHAKKTNTSKKIRVAHVVAQLVDGEHAPTRLLRNLVNNYDKERFEVVVLSTERVKFFMLEFFPSGMFSPPSEERGQDVIREFKSNGVRVLIDKNAFSFEQAAKNCANQLNELNIDIVIFHGPDVINLMTTQFCNCFVRTLFDHGTLTTYPGFDLAILSTEESKVKYKSLLENVHTESKVLHFCVDSRNQWSEKAFTKQEMGFPENSFIMTTISSHLDNRLSSELCQAIAEILKRNPNAYYAPMGYTANPDKFLKVFSELGVGDRVRYLGYKEDPSQWARSMDLYLNEFPFGSGLAILDAMASGCPVVTMYDPSGPPQAYYGGLYFGADHAITSGKSEDYIELACRLIQDKNLHNDWKDYSLTQYEKFANIPQYAKSFEKILLDFLKSKE